MNIIDRIKKACEQCIEDSNEAIEEVNDGSEDIYEGRMEFAEQILSLIVESEKEYRFISSSLQDYEDAK